jgi:hypothetical protein
VYYIILLNQKKLFLIKRALAVLSNAIACERFIGIEPTIFVEMIVFNMSSYQMWGLLWYLPMLATVSLFQSFLDFRGRVRIGGMGMAQKCQIGAGYCTRTGMQHIPKYLFFSGLKQSHRTAGI